MSTATLCLVIALTAQHTPESVREELNQYYETGQLPPSWDESALRIASSQVEERRDAATHIVQLLAQSLKDEGFTDAKNPNRRFSRFEDPASRIKKKKQRKFRSIVIERIKRTLLTPEILPILDWIFENEPAHQRTAIGILGKTDGKAADEYRLSLAQQPHPNAEVMEYLLRQFADRKLELPTDQLQVLCYDHRMFVRRNARLLNEQLGRPDPGPFDPVDAIRSPEIRQLLDELQSMLFEMPDKDAKFVEVTICYRDAKHEIRKTETTLGWIVKRDASRITIFTPSGHQLAFRDNEKKKIQIHFSNESGEWLSYLVATVSFTVEEVGVDDYVQEITKQGGLPSTVLTAWFDRNENHKMVAATLFPEHRAPDIDREFAYARQQLGIIMGMRMLDAFADHRDYEKSLDCARAIQEYYPNTRFSGYAARLAEQLPRRMDDFRTFKLPTPDKWKEIKSGMSRAEKIDFLCQRIRLYSDVGRQYAESHADREKFKKSTQVINPLVELGRLEKPISTADIPLIVPHLKEDWHVPVTSSNRMVTTNRRLWRSRTLIANLINELASRDLCDLKTLDELPPEQVDSHLNRIIAWAEANKNKSKEKLGGANANRKAPSPHQPSPR